MRRATASSDRPSIGPDAGPDMETLRRETRRAVASALKDAWHTTYDVGYAPELASPRALLITWRDLSGGQPVPLGRPLIVVYARAAGRRPSLLISAEAVRAVRDDLVLGRKLTHVLRRCAMHIPAHRGEGAALAVDGGEAVQYAVVRYHGSSAEYESA